MLVIKAVLNVKIHRMRLALFIAAPKHTLHILHCIHHCYWFTVLPDTDLLSDFRSVDGLLLGSLHLEYVYVVLG